MPLLRNTLQPYFIDNDAPAPQDCSGQYCYPVADGDITRQEFYQTPCNPSIVCNPDFDENTLGAELIVNGDFATNADDWYVNAVEIGSTTCPATVDSWCWNTGKLGHDGTDNNSDMVSQTVMGLVAGNVYRVVWTMQGRTQGSLYVQLGDGVGATQGAIQETNGTYTEFLFYNDAQDTISFVPSEDFDGNLDDVSLKLLTTDCWTGEYWTFDPDNMVACKTISTAAANLINNDTDYITSGNYYMVSVTVLGYVSGSIQVYIDDGTDTTATNPQTAITANGTYTYWITASQDGVIAFDPSTDFVGCLSTPTVQELRNDHVFNLINEAGDSLAIPLDVEYVENKVTLLINWAHLREEHGLDYGCFTVQITDACLISGENLVQDPNFANGDFSEWTRNSHAFQYNMSGGELEFIFEPLSDNPTLVTNGDFSAGATGWTVGANWVVGVGSATHTPGSTATLSQTITLSPPVVNPQYMWTWWQVVVTGRTAGSFTITISDKTSATYSLNDTITHLMIPTIGGSVTMAITPTSTFDGTISLIAVHETTNIWNALPIVTNAPNLDYVTGNYSSIFDITAITGTTANTIGAYLNVEYIDVPSIGRSVATHNSTFAYTPGTTKTQLVGVFVKDSGVSGNIYYPGTVTVDNLDIHRIEPFEATYTSECFDYKESHDDDSKIVTAWCDQDALGSTWEDNFGFSTTGFVLQMRVNLRSLNADLDKEVNIAKYSDGNASVTYGQFEKYWQLVTDYMSESALIALGAMAHCDHFMIGTTGEDDTEYIVTVERFTPQWRTEGDYDLAPAVLTIRVKTGGMKFNRHV